MITTTTSSVQGVARTYTDNATSTATATSRSYTDSQMLARVGANSTAVPVLTIIAALQANISALQANISFLQGQLQAQV
jgi:hypothetical protein